MQTFVLHLSHQTETPFFCADLQITEGAWEISFTTNRKEFSNNNKKIDWYFLPC
jgi:16S rRNA A1518/A1519 N6-dimethyltransferase RsmA/KsgA/DIM1 with predicted DNA glycosylase/AP lyase activity